MDKVQLTDWLCIPKFKSPTYLMQKSCFLWRTGRRFMWYLGVNRPTRGCLPGRSECKSPDRLGAPIAKTRNLPERGGYDRRVPTFWARLAVSVPRRALSPNLACRTCSRPSEKVLIGGPPLFAPLFPPKINKIFRYNRISSVPEDLQQPRCCRLSSGCCVPSEGFAHTNWYQKLKSPLRPSNLLYSLDTIRN